MEEEYKPYISEKRRKHFDTLTEEEKRNLTSKDFTVSEIIWLISETPMRDEDKRIAVKRFVQCKTLEQIAEETELDIKTVKKRVTIIELELKLTCLKAL